MVSARVREVPAVLAVAEEVVERHLCVSGMMKEVKVWEFDHTQRRGQWVASFLRKSVWQRRPQRSRKPTIHTFSTGVGVMPRSLNLTWGELGSRVMSVDIIFTSSVCLFLLFCMR